MLMLTEEHEVRMPRQNLMPKAHATNVLANSCRLALALLLVVAAPHQLPCCSAGALRRWGVASFLDVDRQTDGEGTARFRQHVSCVIRDLEPPGLTLLLVISALFASKIPSLPRSRSSCFCFTHPHSSAQTVPLHSPCLIPKPALDCSGMLPLHTR